MLSRGVMAGRVEMARMVALVASEVQAAWHWVQAPTERMEMTALAETVATPGTAERVAVEPMARAVLLFRSSIAPEEMAATAAARALKARVEAERLRVPMVRLATAEMVATAAMAETCPARVILVEPEGLAATEGVRPEVSQETAVLEEAAEMGVPEQSARWFRPTEATEPLAVLAVPAEMEVE